MHLLATMIRPFSIPIYEGASLSIIVIPHLRSIDMQAIWLVLAYTGKLAVSTTIGTWVMPSILQGYMHFCIRIYLASDVLIILMMW